MPTLDLFHKVVKTALEKDGWTITHDPYKLSLGLTDLYIDPGSRENPWRREGRAKDSG